MTKSDKNSYATISATGWLTKKMLSFRWPKTTKIALEIVSFLRNILLSIFKFSPFLYTMKACRRNLISFFKIYKRFHKEREKKKKIIQQSMKNRKTEKSWTFFKTIL